MNDPLGLLSSINLQEAQVITPTTRARRPLLEPHPDIADAYILRMDNSTLERLDTCPRSSEYYCVNRRQGISGAALAFGGALHLGLELYYKGHDINHCVTRACERYAPTVLRPDEWRTTDFLAHTLALYHRNYAHTDISPLTYDDKPFVEIGFSLPLGVFPINGTVAYSNRMLTGQDDDSNLYISELHVLWSGKIDLADRHIGAARIVDHKTSSIDGPSFYDQFYLSQPVHGYAWACEQILGEPISQFLLNALVIRKPTRTGTSNQFIRRSYRISEDNKREFHQDVTSKIEDFVNYLTTGYFPKSPVWCQSKYGACQYFNVCQMDRSGKSVMLASDLYEDVTWSPLSDD
jgi:hypothetical protein